MIQIHERFMMDVAYSMLGRQLPEIRMADFISIEWIMVNLEGMNISMVLLWQHHRSHEQ